MLVYQRVVAMKFPRNYHEWYPHEISNSCVRKGNGIRRPEHELHPMTHRDTLLSSRIFWLCHSQTKVIKGVSWGKTTWLGNICMKPPAASAAPRHPQGVDVFNLPEECVHVAPQFWLDQIHICDVLPPVVTGQRTGWMKLERATRSPVLELEREMAYPSTLNLNMPQPKLVRTRCAWGRLASTHLNFLR